MRYTGQYNASSVPSVTTLVGLLAPTHQQALQPLTQTLEEAAQVYAGAAPNVHRFECIGLTIQQADLVKIAYKKRSAAVRAQLQAMVETLPKPNSGLCPFCSIDTDPELDHWLPQSQYPEHCFNPRNLVPICGPCNKAKGTSVKNAAGERIVLNPLHDTLVSYQLLQATVNFVGVPHTQYHLERHGSISVAEFELAHRHFTRLKLASRLARRANGALSAFLVTLRGRSEGSIRASIGSALTTAESVGPANSWELALWRELAGNLDQVTAWLST